MTDSQAELAKYRHVNKAVYGMVPINSEVLDVGCWEGNLGYELIKNKDCIVDGIDFEKTALSAASTNGYRKVYLQDLNTAELSKDIDDRYDVIVFADVLEHLIHPEIILSYYLKFLKDTGKVVVSLPNIGFILYRFKLLFGRFDYKEVGVMDKTHLKFYTPKTMLKLFDDCNLEVVSKALHNEVATKYKLLEILKHVDPALFTLQFVFLLQPKHSQLQN